MDARCRTCPVDSGPSDCSRLLTPPLVAVVGPLWCSVCPLARGVRVSGSCLPASRASRGPPPPPPSRNADRMVVEMVASTERLRARAAVSVLPPEPPAARLASEGNVPGSRSLSLVLVAAAGGRGDCSWPEDSTRGGGEVAPGRCTCCGGDDAGEPAALGPPECGREGGLGGWPLDVLLPLLGLVSSGGCCCSSSLPSCTVGGCPASRLARAGPPPAPPVPAPHRPLDGASCCGVSAEGGRGTRNEAPRRSVRVRAMRAPNVSAPGPAVVSGLGPATSGARAVRSRPPTSIVDPSAPCSPPAFSLSLVLAVPGPCTSLPGPSSITPTLGAPPPDMR
mmetsp:Transcript_595/g.1617  ORF Transcript_595/g.1617 Transcript_595/m.1617 type:complete len:336 (-) Transcript_595:664-1671(-)